MCKFNMFITAVCVLFLYIMVFIPCLRRRGERFSPIHLIHRGEGHSGLVVVYLYSLASGTLSVSPGFNSRTICSFRRALLWFNLVRSVFLLWDDSKVYDLLSPRWYLESKFRYCSVLVGLRYIPAIIAPVSIILEFLIFPDEMGFLWGGEERLSRCLSCWQEAYKKA